MEQHNLLGPHSESEGEGLGALGMEVGLKRGPHQPPKTWERALRQEGVGSSSGEFPPRFSGKQEAGVVRSSAESGGRGRVRGCRRGAGVKFPARSMGECTAEESRTAGQC